MKTKKLKNKVSASQEHGSLHSPAPKPLPLLLGHDVSCTLLTTSSAGLSHIFLLLATPEHDHGVSQHTHKLFCQLQTLPNCNTRWNQPRSPFIASQMTESWDKHHLYQYSWSRAQQLRITQEEITLVPNVFLSVLPSWMPHLIPPAPEHTTSHSKRTSYVSRTTWTDQLKENKGPPFHREGWDSQGSECTFALNTVFPVSKHCRGTQLVRFI